MAGELLAYGGTDVWRAERCVAHADCSERDEDKVRDRVVAVDAHKQANVLQGPDRFTIGRTDVIVWRVARMGKVHDVEGKRSGLCQHTMVYKARAGQRMRCETRM